MNPFKRDAGLQVVARAKVDHAGTGRVLEFPKPVVQGEVVQQNFESIPSLIRDAFLCDLREGRSNLLGFSYHEVLSALSAYRRSKRDQRLPSTSGWLVHSTKGFVAER